MHDCPKKRSFRGSGGRVRGLCPAFHIYIYIYIYIYTYILSQSITNVLFVIFYFICTYIYIYIYMRAVHCQGVPHSDIIGII